MASIHFTAQVMCDKPGCQVYTNLAPADASNGVSDATGEPFVKAYWDIDESAPFFCSEHREAGDEDEDEAERAVREAEETFRGIGEVIRGMRDAGVLR